MCVRRSLQYKIFIAKKQKKIEIFSNEHSTHKRESVIWNVNFPEAQSTESIIRTLLYSVGKYQAHGILQSVCVHDARGPREYVRNTDMQIYTVYIYSWNEWRLFSN